MCDRLSHSLTRDCALLAHAAHIPVSNRRTHPLSHSSEQTPIYVGTHMTSKQLSHNTVEVSRRRRPAFFS